MDRRGTFEGRDFDNVNLTAESGERQVANSTAAVVAVTDNGVRKVDDFVFRWGREGDALRLVGDMGRISYGSAAAAPMHGETVWLKRHSVS